jgi:hypothetical protein
MVVHERLQRWRSNGVLRASILGTLAAPHTAKLVLQSLGRAGIPCGDMVDNLRFDRGSLMDENRQDSWHGLRHPHRNADDFAPLRLRMVEDDDFCVEIGQPIVVLGRHSDVDVRLKHPEISRRHCRFAFDDGVWTVRDLNSLNGVFVNTAKVREAPLQAGDRLRLGTVDFFVELAPAKEITRLIAELVTKA